MAVDFDSYTHNCTYQYIYSHDNMRFMCNCPLYSGHHGNTVRYCLSVNDNKGRSRMASLAGEYGFSFYNNTIINCGEFQMANVYDALIANNIIIPADGCSIYYDLDAPLNNVKFTNNCFYNYFAPIYSSKSVNLNPGFTSNDLNDTASFFLSKDSPLIGAGCKIDDGLTKDFFGNPLDSCNIGCYAGTGTDAEYEEEGFFEQFLNFFVYLLRFISHEIYAMFN